MGYGDLFMLWRDYGSFSEDTLRIYGAEIAFAIGYSFINSFLNFRMIILILTNIYIYIYIIQFGLEKIGKIR